MASEIHQDDVGTRFLMTVKDDGSTVNISGATIKQVIFKKPSDTIVYRSASGVNDQMSSGIMLYDTLAGDLDEAGHYKLQAKVALPSGTYYTDIHTFKVHCNL